MRRFGRSFDTLAVGICANCFSRTRLAREPWRVGTWGRVLTRGPSCAHLTCLNLRVRVHQLFFAPRTVRRLPVPAVFLLSSSSRAPDPVVRGSQGMRLRSLIDALTRPACPVVAGVLGRSTPWRGTPSQPGRPSAAQEPKPSRLQTKTYRAALAATLYSTLHRREAVAIGQTRPRIFFAPPSRRLCCRCCPLAAGLADRSIFRKGAGARSDNAPPTTWFYAAPEGCVGSCRARCRHEACNMG